DMPSISLIFITEGFAGFSVSSLESAVSFSVAGVVVSAWLAGGVAKIKTASASGLLRLWGKARRLRGLGLQPATAGSSFSGRCAALRRLTRKVDIGSPC